MFLKRVVSVSLGSSKRNHKVNTKILGEEFSIERVGTDGDMQKAIKTIEELDGQVDAFGMGGIDLYVVAGKKRYVLRDAIPIAKAAKKTPIVDGSGLKNTLERRVIKHLSQSGYSFEGKKVLMVSAVDRFGMAEALVEEGAKLTMGDLLYTIGLPFPIYSLRTLDYIARVLGPIVSKLPFSMLYPTGSKQEENTPKYTKYFEEADIIAGDFHFIRRYMPEDMKGKDIITNTVTNADKELFRERGIRTLITTTPELEGRSFGTNVMEGVLVAASGKPVETLTVQDYNDVLDRIGFEPRIEELN